MRFDHRLRKLEQHMERQSVAQREDDGKEHRKRADFALGRLTDRELDALERVVETGAPQTPEEAAAQDRYLELYAAAT